MALVVIIAVMAMIRISFGAQHFRKERFPSAERPNLSLEIRPPGTSISMHKTHVYRPSPRPMYMSKRKTESQENQYLLHMDGAMYRQKATYV